MTDGPSEKRLPVWLKLLVGCAVLGGLVAVAMLLLVVVGYVWVVGTGEQHPSRSVAGDATVGMLHFEGDLEDPGISGLLDFLAEEATADRQRNAELPPSFQWMEEFQHQQQNPREFLASIVPTEATVVFDQAADESAPSLAMAVNLRRWERMIRTGISWMASDTGGRGRPRAYDCHGHDCFRMGAEPDPLFFGSVDGTLLVADSAPALDRAVKEVEQAGSIPERLAQVREEPDPAWDLYGVFLGGTDVVEALREATVREEQGTMAPVAEGAQDPGPEGELLDQVEDRIGALERGEVGAVGASDGGTAFDDLVFGVDFVDADRLVGRVEATCADAEAVRATRADLGDFCGEAGQAVRELGGELSCEEGSEARKAWLTLEMVGVKEVLRSALEASRQVPTYDTGLAPDLPVPEIEPVPASPPEAGGESL